MKVSVVIPVFNDIKALPELVGRLVRVAARQSYILEIVVVDDGSSADVWEALKACPGQLSAPAGSGADMVLLRLAQNHGQSRATLCGLMHARGEVLVTIDSDLQQAPEDIPVLIDALCRGADLVYGRCRGAHGVFRRLASEFRRRLTAPLGTALAQASSFRAMKASFFNHAVKPQHAGIFNLDEGLSWAEGAVSSVEVGHYPRKYNDSTYSLASLFSYALLSAWYSRHLPRGLLVIALGLFFSGVYLTVDASADRVDGLGRALEWLALLPLIAAVAAGVAQRKWASVSRLQVSERHEGRVGTT